MSRRSCWIATLAALAVTTIALAGCGGSGSGSSGSADLPSNPPAPITSGHVNITVWEGYTQAESTAIKTLAAQFNRTHPHITVTPQFYGNSDYALQKVLAAIAGGDPPDISYLYGSRRREYRLDLEARAADALAGQGPIVRLAALLSLRTGGGDRQRQGDRRTGAGRQPRAGLQQDAVQAGRPLIPDRELDLGGHGARRAQAHRPGAKKFGWAYINDASEDTVWRFWAMLWQAGGHILTPDNRQAAFDSPAGIKALTYLQNLAQHKAIYLDNGSDTYLPVFNAGHIGMLWTGPWDLQQIIASHVNYGVTILPRAENHQTISGPDNWVMFNNGSRRVAASWEFLKWFTSANVDLKWCLMTGDLPIRDDVQQLPGYAEYLRKYPKIGVWVDNLHNSKQTRPVSTVYPKISTAVGQAVQGVLLGKYQPQQALKQAAQTTDGLLSAPPS